MINLTPGGKISWFKFSLLTSILHFYYYLCPFTLNFSNSAIFAFRDSFRRKRVKNWRFSERFVNLTPLLRTFSDAAQTKHES